MQPMHTITEQPPLLRDASLRASAAARRIWPIRAGAALRDPLVPFLAAGVLLFAGYAWLQAAGREPIRVTPQTEAALVDDFEALTGRTATSQDRARLRREHIARELLLRDALARNIHLTSPEVREALIEKERFLIAGAPAEPTEEELVDYYAGHLDRYQGEPRTSFTHVFRASQPGDARAVLAALNKGETARSDDFWLGADFPQYGESMLRGLFGQKFLENLNRAPTGRWIGPLQSPRGWHFVRVERREPAQRRPYAIVRDQVRQDVMNARTSSAIDAQVARLKETYDVVED